MQKYPQIPLGVRAGGYVLEHAAGDAPPDITLIATGSEVQLALAVCEKLETQDVRARVVSLPCWNLFDQQPVEYKEAVLPPEVPMLAIEAGVSLGGHMLEKESRSLEWIVLAHQLRGRL